MKFAERKPAPHNWTKIALIALFPWTVFTAVLFGYEYVIKFCKDHYLIVAWTLLFICFFIIFLPLIRRVKRIIFISIQKSKH